MQTNEEITKEQLKRRLDDVNGSLMMPLPSARRTELLSTKAVILSQLVAMQANEMAGLVK